MDANSKYFHLHQSDEAFTLDDRVEINWVEIILYPIPLVLFFFFAGSILALPIVLFAAIGYFLFRHLAWFYYTTFSVDKATGEVVFVKMLSNKVRERHKLGTFKMGNITFDPVVRSGTTKYVCSYKTSTTHGLLVVKSEEHRRILEEWFKHIDKSIH